MARQPSRQTGIPMLPSDLGETRTIMAADRTLMAWLRTALSMYSFGFTIYKAIDALAPVKTDSPRHIGLFLVGIGTAALLLGTWNYWLTLRDLERLDKFRWGRPVLLVATIMAVFGIGLFAAILLRLA